MCIRDRRTQADSARTQGTLYIKISPPKFTTTIDTIERLIRPHATILKIQMFRKKYQYALVTVADRFEMSKIVGLLNNQRIDNEFDLEVSEIEIEERNYDPASQTSLYKALQKRPSLDEPHVQKSIQTLQCLREFDQRQQAQKMKDSTQGAPAVAPLFTPSSNGLPFFMPRESIHRATTSLPLQTIKDVMGQPLIRNTSQQHIDSCLSATIEESKDEMAQSSARSSIPQANPILFVRKLPPESNPDHIFRLFSIYGNVCKVKIFSQNTTQGLVALQDEAQATLALNNLNGRPLFGCHLQIEYAKPGTTIKEGTSQLSKDYTGSTENRFRIPGSKNFANITAPSNHLHLSNLPETVNETMLRDLFSKAGAVELIRFITSGNDPTRRMAFVTMKDLDDAIRVLVTYHNHFLEGRYLKISFAKKPGFEPPSHLNSQLNSQRTHSSIGEDQILASPHEK
eukprot:TRINITY_DN22487_c0_g1_i1.p1 TRINITY_DN22487_c0_g1~~TRINITY_DN22487_c0_g1_i1.p1  ORF type:complete len:475 (-),score=49.01 TRINITY_DN22487_c0_g1_i1:37-1401(-)